MPDAATVGATANFWGRPPRAWTTRSNPAFSKFVAIGRRKPWRGALAIAVIAGAEGGRDVFVLLGEVAVRRRIQIGLSGFDYCQVLAGLVEGEEVIISDTAEYLTLPLVAVR